MKRLLKAYLDSNVFIFYLDEFTNSRQVLKAAFAGLFQPVICPHVIDEITDNLKFNYSKDVASKMNNLITRIPNLLLVEREKTTNLPKIYADLVKDKDDLPHICAYLSAGCNTFVTTNRKLIQMKISQQVNFKTPKQFVELLGLNSKDTPNEE